LPLSFKYLGRYCMPATYEKLIIPAISNDLASCFAYTQAGAVKGFGYLFVGAVELLPESANFTKVEGVLASFMKAVKDHVVDGLDLELAEILVNTLDEIVSVLLEKKRQQVDPSWLIRPYLKDMLLMVLKALAVFQTYQLQDKPEPPNVVRSKQTIGEFFKKLTKLSDSPEEAFFDANIAQVVSDAFATKKKAQLATLSLQSPTWRLFHALFDYLTA